MPLRVFWLVFLIGCNSSYAGMFDDEEARRQIAAQQVAIGEVRNQGQALEARIVKLEEVLNNQPLLELHSQIEALRLDLNKLQGQIEVLVNESELTQKRQKDFYIDLDHRLRRIEQQDESSVPAPAASAPAKSEAGVVSEGGESESAVSESAAEASISNGPEPDLGPAAAVAAVVPPTASTPLATSPPVQVENIEYVESAAYEAAYNLFKVADYRDAISSFNKFLKNYPRSNLAPSAHYWIGNSYYALRDFKNAISTQEKLIKTYPDSAKTPDAMLNIASSQQEMNKKTDAKKTLESLIAKYPGSDAAEKAKKRLANIK